MATPGQNRRSFLAALFLNARELAKGSGYCCRGDAGRLAEFGCSGPTSTGPCGRLKPPPGRNCTEPHFGCSGVNID